jgi:hypothetical protein
MGVMPPWGEKSLDLFQTGRESWTPTEKAKIADLNWPIVTQRLA